MNAAQQKGMLDIVRGLRLYGSVPSAEIITRLIGPLSEKEIWDLIAEAEKIGVIERAEMIVEAITPREQEWRLVEGFNEEQLEISA